MPPVGGGTTRSAPSRSGPIGGTRGFGSNINSASRAGARSAATGGPGRTGGGTVSGTANAGTSRSISGPASGGTNRDGPIGGARGFGVGLAPPAAGVGPNRGPIGGTRGFGSPTSAALRSGPIGGTHGFAFGGPISTPSRNSGMVAPKATQYGPGTRNADPYANFLEAFADRTAIGAGKTFNLDPRFSRALFRAIHDAHKKGMWQDKVVGSASRSPAVQAEIYDRSKQGRLFAAAPPGMSNHQYGVAADLIGVGQTGFPVSNYVKQNLARYGLETANPKRPSFDKPHVQLAGANTMRRAGDLAMLSTEPVGSIMTTPGQPVQSASLSPGIPTPRAKPSWTASYKEAARAANEVQAASLTDVAPDIEHNALSDPYGIAVRAQIAQALNAPLPGNRPLIGMSRANPATDAPQPSQGPQVATSTLKTHSGGLPFQQIADHIARGAPARPAMSNAAAKGDIQRPSSFAGNMVTGFDPIADASATTSGIGSRGRIAARTAARLHAPTPPLGLSARDVSVARIAGLGPFTPRAATARMGFGEPAQYAVASARPNALVAPRSPDMARPPPARRDFALAAAMGAALPPQADLLTPQQSRINTLFDTVLSQRGSLPESAIEVDPTVPGNEIVDQQTPLQHSIERGIDQVVDALFNQRAAIRSIGMRNARVASGASAFGRKDPSRGRSAAERNSRAQRIIAALTAPVAEAPFWFRWNQGVA
jgi:hypothetical protein